MVRDMDQEDINYKILREIQQKEKNSPLLTKIDKNFYKKFLEYVKNLELIVKKEKDSRKVKLFSDEIENTRKIALNIYELREKKITQMALSKVRGGKPDLKNLIENEKKFLDSLFDVIVNIRNEVFEQDVKIKKDTPIETNNYEEKVVSNKNPIVIVKQSPPEFVGTDMKTYRLRKDDVLTLSEEMSWPLVKGNVVKQIK